MKPSRDAKCSREAGASVPDADAGAWGVFSIISIPFPTQKDGHLERPSRSKLKNRACVRRRNVIWYHYRRPLPPTLFWVVLQKNARNPTPAKTESAGILHHQPQAHPELPYNVRVA